jgi:flavodoxin I
MNILITYATNSGSTYLVAKYIADRLEEHHHQVNLVNVIETAIEDLTNYDLVFLGSNSWDFDRKEGQPHHAFIQFLDQAKDINLAGRKYILFGCGDRSYQYFCGSLTIIGDFITQHGGEILATPLKINQYYFSDPNQIHQQIDDWLSQVESHFW